MIKRLQFSGRLDGQFRCLFYNFLCDVSFTLLKRNTQTKDALLRTPGNRLSDVLIIILSDVFIIFYCGVVLHKFE